MGNLKASMSKLMLFVKSYAIKCKRVLKLLKYPSKQELIMSMKITIAGFLIIGFIGFLTSLIINSLNIFV
ncbi:MAG: protein translocase SEC61 complex subunit gamma [Candidatus Nanohalarchaeota archaeon]|nr:MAG: protein translocase SEC61 complex subunit gamma [Candidatus Nanohaloarchaeota archaeon]